MSVATFFPRFVSHYASTPDALAFRFSDGSYSYRQFGALVEGIRRVLDLTLTASERFVAIYATQDVWTYASIVAVMATGRAYIPLNPAAPAERNLRCIRQAGAQTLLCTRDSSVLEAICGTAPELRVVETSPVAVADHLRAIPDIDEGTIAYLLFTSGSTGTPKGVPVYHRNLNCFLEAFIDRSDLDLGNGDRFLQMFDLTFDLSVMSFAVPLCLGASCHVVPSGGPGFVNVAKTLADGDVSVALMVPSVLVFLERYFAEIHLPHLRLSMFCGEALNRSLARAWWMCAPNARLLNVYGPTEATIFCSSFEMSRLPVEDEAYQGVVSIGRPMPGTMLRVVDEQLVDVAPGQKGELIIMGGQVTDRYWEDPARTDASFVRLPDGERGYRSGDVVFCQKSDLFYCGRTDHQLKVDGYRIESGEIEHHARQFQGVRDAALVARVSSSGKTFLCLFLLTDAKASAADVKKCRNFLAARLPGYMVPHQIIFVEAFPLNSNGKVDRKALLAGLDQET